MLPTFKLGKKIDTHTVGGRLISQEQHEKVENAITFTIEINEGEILLTLVDGVLSQVIYQTPKLFPWSKKKKTRQLLEAYAGTSSWVEVLDNGFGKTYRRDDETMVALWSYVMDFNTFHTQEFHQLKYK